jgi:hypothetical protein
VIRGALLTLALGGCMTTGLETDQHELDFESGPTGAHTLDVSALPQVSLDVTGDAAAKEVAAHVGITVWKRQGEFHYDHTQGDYRESGDTLTFRLLDLDDSEETTIDGVSLVAPASFGLIAHRDLEDVTARGLLGPVEITGARRADVEDCGPVNLEAESVTARLGRGGQIDAEDSADVGVIAQDFDALEVSSKDATIQLPPGVGYDLDLEVGQEGTIAVVAGANDVRFGGKTGEFHPRLEVGPGGPHIIVHASQSIVVKDFPGPLPMPRT